MIGFIFHHWKAVLIIVLIILFIIWLYSDKIKQSIPNIPIKELYELAQGKRLPDNEKMTQVEAAEVATVAKAAKAPEITDYQEKHPNHKSSKGEKICCQVLEDIFGVKFASDRPDFLRNPKTGYPMELDCYNPSLQLAVEYNGIQHYIYPNFLFRTEKDFLDQVERDRVKVELCDENGIYLITVPYYLTKYDDIREYITERIPETLSSFIIEEESSLQ